MNNIIISPVKESRFWAVLWATYRETPSVALCRLPEIEYASTLDVTGRTLDHCCGDGIFASLAWPQTTITAGCDIRESSVEAACRGGTYSRVDRCDASKHLPYDDESFDLVFNNSGLEHILDLDAALREITRVLRKGGRLAFNVLNRRYFEWWPVGRAAMDSYRRFQPFHHALDLNEWTEQLARAGLKVESVEGYFDKVATQELARLDYEFSALFLAGRHSRLVSLYQRFPSFMQRYWHRRLSRLPWKTAPDKGAGYFICATRNS